ncbi:exonuclease SbcCD subunit D C-terminal domain-containing protein [Alkanindiges sp. WGS2144]|uniref:exonuclease SbcCD subunit D C-terminal domain-containing protein n=1 Tax=Alkanindiges sp. WGS2144 TaxID=3366808 RepID=UPI0037523144
MLHFFHTSDWHLGQFFYHHSRHYEHECFLQWLLEQLEQHQPDALLIAGDIFDVVNPSTTALKQLNQFIAAAHQKVSHLQILMIAGNHDSGHRLEQVEPLLAKYNAHVVGIIEWQDDNTLNLDKLLRPIYNAQQQICAWCIALPYLRPAEITGYGQDYQDTAQATQALYQQLIEEAQRRKTPEQSLLLMTHAHMQGGTSSDSERPIVVGNAEALSTSLFHPDIQYVALGHLHCPQYIEQEHIRYSGSPIPLSFSEVHYKHQVVKVQLEPQTQARIESLPVPRRVPLFKIKGKLTEVLDKVKNLEACNPLPLAQQAFVDIEYSSDTPPPPDFRQQIEAALPKDNYRLVRLSRMARPQVKASGSAQPVASMEAPTPLNLFQQLWQKQGYQDDQQVTKDFQQLFAQAEHHDQSSPSLTRPPDSQPDTP